MGPAWRPPLRGLGAVPLVDPVPTVTMQVAWRADAGPLVGAFLECVDAAAPFTQAA